MIVIKERCIVPSRNALENWTVVEEEALDDNGCDEDGECFSSMSLDLCRSLKVWERAYHHQNYLNGMEAVTYNG